MKKITVIALMCFCLMGCASAKLRAVKGKGGAEVIVLKGRPSSKLHEDGREMWTYRYDKCTEIIFFDASGAVTDLRELGECPIPE